MPVSAAAQALWARVQAVFAAGAWRIQTQSDRPGHTEFVELDAASGRFHREVRLPAEGGTGPQGLCQRGDGRWVAVWDPVGATDVWVDSQAPCLADALEHEVAVLLDPDFQGRICSVEAAAGPEGEQLRFTLGDQRWVAVFAGDPPLLCASWVESAAGERTACRAYRTTSIAAVADDLPLDAPRRPPRWVVAPAAGVGGRGRPLPPLAGPLSQGDGAQPAVRVVEFWASWCGKCRQSLHHLEEVRQRFGERVFVLGVNRDADPGLAWAFAQARALSFPVLWDDGRLAAAWGVRGLPALYVLDGDWRMIAMAHAGVPGADLVAAVGAALAAAGRG